MKFMQAIIITKKLAKDRKTKRKKTNKQMNAIAELSKTTALGRFYCLFRC